MEIQEIIQRYIRLLAQYGVALEVSAVPDPASPRPELSQTPEGFLLRLNPDGAEFEERLAANARKILLPRLTLETPRLLLRRFRMEDAGDCFPFLSDPEGCYFNGYEPFAAMDAEYQQLMRYYQGEKKRLMIVRKDTGRVIGTVVAEEVTSRAVSAMELGYQISPEFRRQGYATEAIRALISLLQNDLRVELLLAGVMVDNLPSANMLRKLGFQKEGTWRKALRHDALGPVDLDCYYLDRHM